MAISMDTMLGLSTRFHVSVQGVDLGGWAQCQGLEVKFNPVFQPEGGNYQYQTILPGEIKYTPVTLSRAMNAFDTGEVQKWLRIQAADWVDGNKSGTSGTARIVLFDAHGAVVSSWTLRNVYPDSWKGPDLDAMTMGIAVERLVLVHEGFL